MKNEREAAMLPKFKKLAGIASPRKASRILANGWFWNEDICCLGL